MKKLTLGNPANKKLTTATSISANITGCWCFMMRKMENTIFDNGTDMAYCQYIDGGGT